jgi:hypothetical protein
MKVEKRKREREKEIKKEREKAKCSPESLNRFPSKPAWRSLELFSSRDLVFRFVAKHSIFHNFVHFILAK